MVIPGPAPDPKGPAARPAESAPSLLLKNFRVVDEASDFYGSALVEDGRITALYRDGEPPHRAERIIDGGGRMVLMPAFVDLHAHFREPAFPESGESGGMNGGANGVGLETRLPSEDIESACRAAAAGGFGTVVCMANTRPPTDTIKAAAEIRRRAAALGLVDLYPALSLTRGMEGKALSEITLLPGAFAGKEGGAPDGPDADSTAGPDCPVRLLSEDGQDIPGDDVFLAALGEARRAGLAVSCHCDINGENAATVRALELAERTGARVHIAHVSTAGAAAAIRRAKERGLSVSCEVTPHHLALTEKDAAVLGADTHGKVSPPLRGEEDRRALLAAVADGVVDAIATDHAPHSRADKEGGGDGGGGNGKGGGRPGFSGLETAFAVCYGILAAPPDGAPGTGGKTTDNAPLLSLSRLSSLLSAAPARILGLDRGGGRRGLIAPGYRADLVILDLAAAWTVDPAAFFSKGNNSPFAGRTLRGRVLAAISGGRIVFENIQK